MLAFSGSALSGPTGCRPGDSGWLHGFVATRPNLILLRVLFQRERSQRDTIFRNAIDVKQLASYLQAREELTTRTTELAAAKAELEATKRTFFFPGDWSARAHPLGVVPRFGLAVGPRGSQAKSLLFFHFLSQLYIRCAAAAAFATELESLCESLEVVRGKRDEIAHEHDRLVKELARQTAEVERLGRALQAAEAEKATALHAEAKSEEAATMLRDKVARLGGLMQAADRRANSADSLVKGVDTIFAGKSLLFLNRLHIY